MTCPFFFTFCVWYHEVSGEQYSSKGSTQGLALALALAGFLFLSQFQSGPGAAAVIARLVAVSACSPLNCKTRVRRLYTAHFTHYFHIAQITAIQPPLFRVGRESGGREGVGQKALIAPHKSLSIKTLR